MAEPGIEPLNDSERDPYAYPEVRDLAVKHYKALSALLAEQTAEMLKLMLKCANDE